MYEIRLKVEWCNVSRREFENKNQRLGVKLYTQKIIIIDQRKLNFVSIFGKRAFYAKFGLVYKIG